MRTLLRVFTALPVIADPRAEASDAPDTPAGPDVAWSLAPLVGLLLGLVAYLAQQLTVEPVGPLASGAIILVVMAAMTGGVGHRAVGEIALRLAGPDDTRPSAPARPGGAAAASPLAVTLLLVLQVTLLQRIHSAPQLLVVLPVAAVTAQAVLLTAADQVALPTPRTGDRVSALLLALLVMPLPLGLAAISRTPFGFNGELAGAAGVVVAVVALVAGLLGGMLARAWALSRFDTLDTAGWRLVGLTAETAALLVVAIRVA